MPRALGTAWRRLVPPCCSTTVLGMIWTLKGRSTIGVPVLPTPGTCCNGGPSPLPVPAPDPGVPVALVGVAVVAVGAAVCAGAGRTGGVTVLGRARVPCTTTIGRFVRRPGGAAGGVAGAGVVDGVGEAVGAGGGGVVAGAAGAGAGTGAGAGAGAGASWAVSIPACPNSAASAAAPSQLFLER